MTNGMIGHLPGVAMSVAARRWLRGRARGARPRSRRARRRRPGARGRDPGQDVRARPRSRCSSATPSSGGTATRRTTRSPPTTARSTRATSRPGRRSRSSSREAGPVRLPLHDPQVHEGRRSWSSRSRSRGRRQPVVAGGRVVLQGLAPSGVESVVVDELAAAGPASTARRPAGGRQLHRHGARARAGGVRRRA